MKTILFVDDHHAFRTVFAEVLRAAGYFVLEAATEADAEHVIERHSHPVDVMIVEAILSTENGMDVVKHVKTGRSKTRVLFISEYPAEELRKQGLLPKGADFLRKPFDAEHLLNRVGVRAAPARLKAGG